MSDSAAAILTLVVEYETKPIREDVAALVQAAKDQGEVVKADLHVQPQPARVEDLRT